MICVYVKRAQDSAKRAVFYADLVPLTLERSYDVVVYHVLIYMIYSYTITTSLLSKEP